MGIGNQLEIFINRTNLEKAKEKIYMMLEGKLGLKEKDSTLFDIMNKYDLPDLEELDNTLCINFENTSSYPEKVVIVIKSIESETCISFYKMIKEVVRGL